MEMKKIFTRPDGFIEYTENIIKSCQEDGRRYYSTIRRLARNLNLVARKSRKRGWLFTDYNNYLQSPEQGLDDVEALEYLLQEDE